MPNKAPAPKVQRSRVVKQQPSNQMLCEKCNEREATVHLTKNAPGKEPVQRHFCAVCLPLQAMSEAEQADRLAQSFEHLPPEEPEEPERP